MNPILKKQFRFHGESNSTLSLLIITKENCPWHEGIVLQAHLLREFFGKRASVRVIVLFWFAWQFVSEYSWSCPNLLPFNHLLEFDFFVFVHRSYAFFCIVTNVPLLRQFDDTKLTECCVENRKDLLLQAIPKIPVHPLETDTRKLSTLFTW